MNADRQGLKNSSILAAAKEDDAQSVVLMAAHSVAVKSAKPPAYAGGWYLVTAHLHMVILVTEASSAPCMRLLPVSRGPYRHIHPATHDGDSQDPERGELLSQGETMSGAVQQQGNMSAGNAPTAAQGDWPGDWPGDGGGNWPPRNPRLYDINPSSGSTAGGNIVVLTGSNLQGTYQVTFGGTPATNVTPNQYGNSVTVTAPPHAAGTVSVVATSPYGSTNPLTYTYIAVPVGPTVSALVPNTGPTTGGTAFAIIGTNLSGASVTFNGVPATGVSVNGAGTVLTGTTPPGAAGLATVVVTTPLGSTTVAGGFTYVAPPPLPVTTGISPASGTAAGGTAFVITGSNLNGASVTFNGVAATGVSVNPAGTAIVGFTPAGAVGLATVVVTTPFGTSTVPGGYTYTAPPLPVTTGITPNTGPTAGGTAFVITGSNLNGASVTFNGVAATGVSVNPAGTAIVGFTPAGAAGNVPVVVTTLGGSATVGGGYTYV